MVFPIRGHSYLECDRDMNLIKTKSLAEIPDDRINIFKSSRIRPNLFQIIDCTKNFEFQTWTEFFLDKYSANCPMPTREIRIVECCKNRPRFIMHKSNCFGNYLTSDLESIQRKNSKKKPCVLEKLHNAPISIKKAKHADLKHLRPFLTCEEAKVFYDSLLCENNDVNYGETE